MSSKSAAKLAARYAKMKPLPAPSNVQDASDEPRGTQVPETLRSGQPGARMWDVYFNGHKQSLCCYADRTQGTLTRYTRGQAGRPTTKETESLRGSVQFVPRGAPCPREAGGSLPVPSASVGKLLYGPNFDGQVATSGYAVVDEAAEFPREALQNLGPRRMVAGPSSAARILAAATVAVLAAGLGSDDGKDR